MSPDQAGRSLASSSVEHGHMSLGNSPAGAESATDPPGSPPITRMTLQRWVERRHTTPQEPYAVVWR